MIYSLIWFELNRAITYKKSTSLWYNGMIIQTLYAQPYIKREEVFKLSSSELH